MGSAIEISGLTKYYCELLAVDHIDLDVQEGEVFGFLGPNGAGKTTTIRMLTGLTRPSSGTARVLGHDIATDITAAKNGFGVVPELSNLYNELTAMDNLVFMGQLYGVPRQQRTERARELLEIFALSERRGAPFAALSRGMKRALTIAAALIHRPQLLFLDEPTVGLDVVNARSLRALIRDLNTQGMSVFLTTHYLEEADLLCDRIAILVRGKIVALDTPENLKARLQREPACEVRFEPMPADVEIGLANQKAISRVEKSRDGLLLYGDSISLLAEAIHGYARDKGLDIVSINTMRPSLEDAFVQLTGLSSEVMLAEKGGR